MNELQRIRKVCKWLIFSGFGENETELAILLGYKKSSFSQLLNGKVPLSGKFIDKLCELDKNINKVWILTGEGDMLKENDLVNLIEYKSLAEGRLTIMKLLNNLNNANKKTIDSQNETIETLKRENMLLREKMGEKYSQSKSKTESTAEFHSLLEKKLK